MDAWKVNKNGQAQLLGLTDNESIQWQNNRLETPSPKTLNNIAHTFDIYKGLSILFPNVEQAHKWPNKVNTQFNGISAITFILNNVERNLSIVHDYLDKQLVGLGDF
jgi:hypothetical protein